MSISIKAIITAVGFTTSGKSIIAIQNHTVTDKVLDRHCHHCIMPSWIETQCIVKFIGVRRLLLGVVRISKDKNLVQAKTFVIS